MKPAEHEPGCALAFGFVGAPFIAGINAAIMDALWGHASLNSAETYPALVFLTMIVTVPLGFLTMALLEMWSAGKHAKARWLGAIYGIVALIFWIWLFRISGQTWTSPEMPRNLGALAIPIIWSLLIPLFALCARSRK